MFVHQVRVMVKEDQIEGAKSEGKSSCDRRFNFEHQL